MVSLVKVKFSIIILFLVIGCQIKSTLYLNGDANTIGAKVYIDTTYVGEIRKNNSGGELIIKIEPGVHKLLVINNKGEKFIKEFSIEGENYISVSFKKNGFSTYQE